MPSRHHYVPRFYLEGFTAGDPPMLWVYDKDKGGRRRVSTRDTGLETHYHSITRDDGTRDPKTLEDAFSELESDSAPVLHAIRAGRVLEAEERRRLAGYMAVQMTRVPSARRDMETLARSLGETLMRPVIQAQLEGSPDQQWARTKRMLEELQAAGLPALRSDDVIIEPRRETTLGGVVNASAYAELFYDMRWLVFPARGRYSFVTSDNPVVYGSANLASPVGLASPDVVVVFPLSKKLCLVANWGRNGGRQWSVPRSKASEAMVAGLNKCVIRGALRFVYSDQDSNGLAGLVSKFRDSAPQLVVDGPDPGGPPPLSF